MRGVHRFVGAILALQLIAWIVTGLFFNVKHGYEEVYERLAPQPAPESPDAPWVSPTDAMLRLGLDPAAVRSVRLLRDHRGYTYLFEAGTPETPSVALADARTGDAVPPLDQAGAEAAFRSALAGSKFAQNYGALASATQTTAPSTTLGAPAPVWELKLETGQTVTVNAYTADIAHTSPWATVIDWTYRVHYMQYTPWPRVNEALVLAFSALLLVLVLSGLNMLVRWRESRRYGGRPKLRL
jgi:uncharacterized iron-regulated membrane protein